MSLTSLRGWLALWVVLYHFWNDVICLFPSMKWASPFAVRGNMAVPGFFMLSGFVLSYNYAQQFQQLSPSSVGRFILLRLARIYPVHFVSLLIVLAMLIVSRHVGFKLTDAGYTPTDFFRNLFLIQTWVPHFELNWNYPSWSISSEWLAYLLFPLFVAHGLCRLTSFRRAFIFGVIALLGSILLMTSGRPVFYEMLLVIPNFLAGAAIHWMTRRDAKYSLGLRLLTAAMTLAIPLVCLGPNTESPVFRDAVVTAGLLVLFFSLIWALALQKDLCRGLWVWTPAVFLGDVSYSLYMTHTLAQKIVYKLLPSAKFALAGPIVKLMILGVYAIGIAVFCMAMYYLVERPCREAFRKRRPAKLLQPSPA